jgi:DNA excision repair protein ERCC-6-like 2
MTISQVFLISTRAGNLGVNLVSANRVVIFDPSWNPAQDLQAQDRSFRYGQKRHVTVFRFLAAGSLEELVYTRQIYKQQLSNIAVSGKLEKRYFEGVQVYIFIMDNTCPLAGLIVAIWKPYLC